MKCITCKTEVRHIEGQWYECRNCGGITEDELFGDEWLEGVVYYRRMQAHYNRMWDIVGEFDDATDKEYTDIIAYIFQQTIKSETLLNLLRKEIPKYFDIPFDAKIWDNHPFEEYYSNTPIIKEVIPLSKNTYHSIDSGILSELRRKDRTIEQLVKAIGCKRQSLFNAVSRLRKKDFDIQLMIIRGKKGYRYVRDDTE